MSFLKKIDPIVVMIEKIIAGIGIFVTLILVFSEVISRHLFSFSFSWVGEITQYIMLWVSFIGAAICIRNNENVSIDLIFHFLPEKIRKYFLSTILFLSAVFCIYFTYISFIFVSNTKTMNQLSVSMTWLPIYLVYLSAPIGFLFLIYEFIRFAYRNWFAE